MTGNKPVPEIPNQANEPKMVPAPSAEPGTYSIIGDSRPYTSTEPLRRQKTRIEDRSMHRQVWKLSA